MNAELALALSGGLSGLGPIGALIQGGLSGGLSGLVHTGEFLAGQFGAGLSGGLSGLVHTGEFLAGQFGAGLSGLVQTGESLTVVWVWRCHTWVDR